MIKVAAGIGDNVWLFQKLITTGQKYKFSIAGDIPRRGQQIFDLLPDLVVNSVYGNHSSVDAIAGNSQRMLKTWEEINRYQNFFLCANKHLEQGLRIEEFLPDLDTVFELPFQTQPWSEEASSMINGEYIGIYTSSYSVKRHWNFWDVEDWVKVITSIHKKKPYKFVIFGASFDIDFSSHLATALPDHIHVTTCIGRELGLVIECLRRVKQFIAFPSGLPIISTMIKTPTIMFYPAHLRILKNSWAHPEADYKAFDFVEPIRVLEYLNDKGLYE